jgi:hypothetical protein
LVQRDCYSAFLAKNLIENQHKRSHLREDWATAELLLRRAGLCVEQSGSGERLRFPTVTSNLCRQTGLHVERGLCVVKRGML